MIEKFDLYLFHAINGWCGHWFLDNLVNVEERLYLINGTIVLFAYWWLWFEGGETRRAAQRRILISMLLAGIAALFVARGLADVLPFRVRPMFAGIPYNPPSMHIVSDYENWSSFPSDHAAMYFALALGVFMLWRAMGAMLMTYASVWICLPRVYLGLHYPTDIIAGAAIGMAVAGTAFLIARGRLFDRIVASPLLRLERNCTPLFYALVFGAAVEIAALFADIRDLVRHSGFLFQLGFAKGACLVIACVAIIAFFAKILRRRIQFTSTALAEDSIPPESPVAQNGLRQSVHPNIGLHPLPTLVIPDK